ncbi:MAG: phosphotransferase [Verrucomicrobia bacterium]|nr:phosphotransferase [Verrucomicrobiota bacterium]
MTAAQHPQLDDILAAFGLGRALDVRPLGGTAARKWDILTERGRFVIRRRPDEFADAGSVGFDHAVLRRLDAAGFPVPCPVGALVRDDGTYEVLRWIEGEPFPDGDTEAIAEAGGFLARFHKTLATDFPAGKEGRHREDHPDLMTPYLAAFNDAGQRQAIETQLSMVRRELDQRLYGTLPRAIIHGDFHLGNVRFRAGRVAALYDFDYLAVQARVRDVSDALIFFASRRRQPVNPDDIRSLTQPFVPDAERCRRLLAGYQTVSRLTDAEWDALPWLIRSRWTQMRLRGSRKVPPTEKVPFVLHDFFEVINWLDNEGSEFFESLRRQCA